MRLRRRSRRTHELDCHEVRRHVQSFLDGELTELDAAAVGRHLERCRECGIEEDTLRQVIAAVARRRQPTDANVRARLVRFAEDLVEDAGQS